MKMASNDAASPSSDGAANLVPESQQEVMALEPVAGAQLAAPVAGQQNIIDPWIKLNFVQAPNGEFTVSPRNAVGEVLLNVELGPELNPYLAHLAQMYNGYAGGMEVEVVLAGNAFTAGKILFAAVPPNFPTDGISAAQATMFPHVIVDVRTLEPIRLPLPDVRNVMFHFNQQHANRMRIVAILYTPLRTNGGAGDDVFTVSCRVLTRPAPDFEFMFLVPPTVESKTKQFSLPQFTLEEMTNSRWPMAIEMMYTDPAANLVVQPQNGRCTIDGTLLGTTPLRSCDLCSFFGTFRSASRSVEQPEDTEQAAEEAASGGPRPRAAAAKVLELTQPDGSQFEPGHDLPAPQGTPDFVCEIAGIVSQRDTTATPRGVAVSAWLDVSLASRGPQFAPALGTVAVQLDNNTNVRDNIPTVFRADRVIHVNQGDFHQWRLPNYGGELAPNQGLAPPVAPRFPGEQILFFRSQLPFERNTQGHGYIDCLLPQEWVSYFYQDQAPSQGDVALLRYYNPDTGRVLFEAKLHKEGFLTVATSGSNPIVAPGNGYFRFEAWVNHFYALTPMGTGASRRGRRMER